MSESVRSVELALNILEHLSCSDTPLGPTKLAQLTGMDKSTVYRLLSTLSPLGYVHKQQEGYILGPKLVAMVSRYISSLELQTEAKPYLSQLSTDLGLTTHLGMLDGCEVIYVEKMDTVPTAQLYNQIGERKPAYSSSLGKCLLSNLSGSQLNDAMANCQFKAFTSHTITSLREFREHLRQVRAQGWAIDNEETSLGHICVGAPIYDYKGEIIAAVSASGSTAVITKEYRPVVIETVQLTARAISLRMGYFD